MLYMKKAWSYGMMRSAKTSVYEAPKLVHYGDLVEVTRALSGTGANDHAHGANKTA
jgi:hypothetical protein